MNDKPIWVDLKALSSDAKQGGPQWGLATEELNATLLWWSDQHSVAPHVNNELDVFLLVVDGHGEVVVDGEVFDVGPGQALLIPRGTERAIRSTTATFCYLNIHRRRRLMPQVTRKSAI